ncbi:sensor histidine kinase [Streptomyces sp. NPDC086989]|uniref:sensor histidine kinase n=1 Tax=Streptomyces sp. NPDC086989 TaxID=3365764 RepID=UPI00380A2A88
MDAAAGARGLAAVARRSGGVLVPARTGCWLTEHRRQRLVVETRRSQQLELARDLHDFVAHDVSGIVAQAQAARFVATADPGQALSALERIEAAGLNALASMDRMVKTLHEADGGDARPPGADAVAPLPGVDGLAALVAQFSSAGPALAARLHVAPGATDGLSRATGSTAYRVVVEALTNVRRHAPGASRVEVTSPLPAPATARPRSGSRWPTTAAAGGTATGQARVRPCGGRGKATAGAV